MNKDRNPRTRAKALGLLAAALFAISMMGAGNQVAAAPAMNLVQVSLQSAQNLPFQYTFTAYNSSGYQAASYQSSYPAAGFQVPSGTYLVTASAFYQNSTLCTACARGAGGSAATASGKASILPYYVSPYTEYGYSVAKVSGPASLTIRTQNASATPLSSLTIHAKYANGTAAAGAYVSGHVVGSYYVYSPKMVAYGQTDKDGSVMLTMPQAPVEVSAYLSLPIPLPKNTTTVPVEVGGQKVNVTVYLQPSYFSLSGQALVLPPQTGADVILQYRPASEPVIYYTNGVPSAGAAGGLAVTVTTTQSASGAGQASGQLQVVTRIAPFNTTGSRITDASPGTAGASSVTLVGVAAGAAVLAIAAAYALWVKKSGKKAPPS